MKKIKILLLLSFVLLIFIGLSACGGKKDSSGKDGEVTLTFWNGFTASDGDILQDIVDEFNESNDKNIKIEMNVMSWDNFNEKLPSAISANKAPDFFAMNAGDFASYVGNGAIKKVNDFWDFDGVDKDDFEDNAVNLGMLNDEQYFIPMQTQGMYLYWNKDIFEENDLDPDKPPRTWKELADLAPKLTDASENQFGIALPTDGSAPLYNWLLAYGGSIANSDYTESTFDSNENIETLKTIQKMVYDQEASPQSISGAEADNLNKAGQLGMYINGPWLNNDLENSDVNYGVTSLPEGSEGDTAILDGVGFGIPASTDDSKTEAIYEFVKHWNTTEIGKKWSLDNGFPPYLKSVEEDSEVQDDPIVSELTEQMDYAKPFMSESEALSSITIDTINPMLEKLYDGEDVNKLAKDTDDQIQDKLSSQE